MTVRGITLLTQLRVQRYSLFVLSRQVLENYRRRSVDGLAWPFLLNWLLGEASTPVTAILIAAC